MATNIQQAQAEGLCLRFPENLGMHRELSYEMALNMLLRATQMAQNIPFTWSYLDKLPEGSMALIFLSQQAPFPIDGIRYQENENRYNVAAGQGRELEVGEVKYGFIPGGQDTVASRVRKRYRLLKGGHPQLVLVHYSQGPQTPIVPALANQPLRSYPLRTVNEPAIYVAGDKMGQKVYPSGMGPMQSGAPPIQQPGMPMNLQQQQAMIAQQNNNMDMLERRRAEERAAAAAAARGRGANTGGRPPHPPEDDSGDEHDQISTRTLALNRYKRNHELMNEVFHHAAFHDKKSPPPAKPYSIFNQDELEEKARKLQEEIEALKTKTFDRQPIPSASTEVADISMGEGIAV